LQKMSMPLSAKVRYSMRVISEYLDVYGVEGTYCSLSGGMDSVVLRHLINRVTGGHNVESIYLDTWMEDPRIRRYVLDFPNVKRLKPELSMKEIVLKYGWCFPSKDVSEAINAYREGKEWAIRKLHGLDYRENYSEYRQRYKKFLIVAEEWDDIKISPYCCFAQKEGPAMKYEKETGKHPFLGLRAEESARRTDAYLKTGCNSFDTRHWYNEETGEYGEEAVARPVSKPLSIWTKQDILQYHLDNDITPAAPYGIIYEYGTCPGQLNWYGDKPCGKLACSGDSRTGCIFCPVGCHLDNFAKFKGVKEYNKKLYDYCMEELGERKLLERVQQTFGGELP